MRGRMGGFTIVELLVVIVVIGILAGLVLNSYAGVQARANDASIRAAVNQFEKALVIWAQDHNLPIRGGSGSSTPVSNGECSNGSSGFVGSGVGYVCSVEDALVSANLLPRGFTAQLPKNTKYGSGSTGGYSLMLYTCGAVDRYALYWTLQAPTAQDTASFNSTLAACNSGTPQIGTTWNMKAGKIIQF